MADSVKKVYDDMWSFTIADATKVSNKLIGVWYKNLDACDFERISDASKHWCLDEPEKCVGLKGMVDNIYKDAPSIISKATDLYDLISVDDNCYSDQEIISEINRAAYDVSSIISTVVGFDLKWD